MEQQSKTKRENELAMFIHLSTLLGFAVPFANIFAPFIIWQIKKDEFPSLEGHGKEAVNFQITMTIFMVASAILAVVFIGVLGAIAVMAISIIYTIQASMEANKGNPYKYPISIRFIK